MVAGLNAGLDQSRSKNRCEGPLARFIRQISQLVDDIAEVPEHIAIPRWPGSPAPAAMVFRQCHP